MLYVSVSFSAFLSDGVGACRHGEVCAEIDGFHKGRVYVTNYLDGMTETFPHIYRRLLQPCSSCSACHILQTCKYNSKLFNVYAKHYTLERRVIGCAVIKGSFLISRNLYSILFVRVCPNFCSWSRCKATWKQRRSTIIIIWWHCLYGAPPVTLRNQL